MSEVTVCICVLYIVVFCHFMSRHVCLSRRETILVDVRWSFSVRRQRVVSIVALSFGHVLTRSEVLRLVVMNGEFSANF